MPNTNGLIECRSVCATGEPDSAFYAVAGSGGGGGGVASVGSGGPGISISGTTINPLINNTGLLGLTSANAGTNITITGNATTPVISATGSATPINTYAGFGFPTPSPNYITPPIPSNTWTVPVAPNSTPILNGNNGYTAIPSNQDMWITCYVIKPFTGSLGSTTPNSFWFIYLTYWTGTEWVQADGYNSASYTNQSGTYIPLNDGIGGGNMANTLGDSILMGKCRSVGGQVRFNISIQQSVLSNTPISVTTNQSYLQYTAVPITTTF